MMIWKGGVGIGAGVASVSIAVYFDSTRRGKAVVSLVGLSTRLKAI